MLAAGRAGSRVPLVVALGGTAVGMVLAVVSILVTGGETAALPDVAPAERGDGTDVSRGERHHGFVVCAVP
jgi:hypothetical protein